MSLSLWRSQGPAGRIVKFDPFFAYFFNSVSFKNETIASSELLRAFGNFAAAAVPISVALRSRIFSFRSRRHFVQVPAPGRSSPFHPGPFFSLLRVRAAASSTDLLQQLSSTFRLISHA